MRCFVAAFVEADSARRLQQAYQAWQGPGRGPLRLRAVAPANYHVTLKFLGEIDDRAVPDLRAAVADLNGTATQGSVLGFVGFPRPAATRVLVAELAPHDLLRAWWALLERSLGTGDQSFRPHVTLARAPRPRPVEPSPLDTPLPVSLQPPRLYRSDPTPYGPRYRPVSNADVNVP